MGAGAGGGCGVCDFHVGVDGSAEGVAVSHGAVVNQLVWVRAEFGLGAGDAVLVKTAATFDLSVWEFWSALVSGGRMVVASVEGHRDPEYLVGVLREQRVTTLHVVPSMLGVLSAAVAGGVVSAWLRRVLVIGEELPAAVAQAFGRGIRGCGCSICMVRPGCGVGDLA